MNGATEKLKKQLLELAGAVNAFDSEAVQERVIDHVLHALTTHAAPGLSAITVLSPDAETNPVSPLRLNKKPGATKIIKGLVHGEFFRSGRTISEITDHINTNFDCGIFYTSQISGVLLHLVRAGKLHRSTKATSQGYSYILK